ncbi:Uma2 family endonuclease [Limnoraphis robusta Tam1]|uniref:Uma2 family endonuclease n=1 Tax=Limnoraphis robusta CCNP1315 TaxID=3110306 RepID=A0ABU5TR36_9CYAN|nr:Uma2 family endonuclease [Limnoraphis robusta]MEA5497563.1 Uma2 family endonuclease [Limnoraphis robusta BA-68 BA1]MEA5517346.1 Uma2 family endonuclease [Limnoraphis robusta CCNP1315]MEA5542974.1 Uma2 family endonuclease [Limnoraphis robusta Tam1]MEA5546065.1 Uma2 family endonuclease [Limnoraphis robusta CCNP1324]
MTIAQDLEVLQTETELENIEFPPGDLESKEPPLESYLHLQQLLLLMKCLDWLWQDRNDYFAAGNLTIYYSLEQKKTDNFRGPDFFVVLNTERKPRKSWVVWEEGGKYPNVIIELLSKSTANVDRTNKKEIYQDIFRTPEYFWFSPDTLEFQGFGLLQGTYEELQPNEQGRLWSKQLNLFLGVYEGKLRFFTPEGILVPTPEESAKTEKQQRETAEQRASEAEETSRQTQEELETERQQRQAEQQRNERLAAKLRELNIDPDTL